MSGDHAVSGDVAPLRVLLLNENIGGHATVHHNLEQVLGPRTDVAATFLHVPPRQLWRKLIGRPVPVLGPLDLDFQPLRGQLAAAVIARRMLTQAGLSAAGGSYDALHVYTQNAGLLSTKLLAAYPTVVSSDSTNALNAARLPYREPTRFTPHAVKVTKLFERRVYDAATLIVANSQWVADSLLTYGVPEGRIRVLPFGVEIPSDAPRRVDPNRPSIVFVGHQLRRKGGRQLIELHQRHLRDRCELVLVTTEEVEPLPGVTIRDDVTVGDGKLADIFAGAAALVFPSTIDQAPNAVLEAMAHGVPVIAMRVGALPEMVDSGRTGTLIEPDDAPALLAAVIELLDDPARGEAWGADGRRLAQERFDIARSADDLLAVLREAQDLFNQRGPIGR